jgi:microcompartment protein CcmK/EutM
VGPPGPVGEQAGAGTGDRVVVSDGLVAASLFGPKRRTVDAAVMLTCAAAQALLAGALEDR